MDTESTTERPWQDLNPILTRPAEQKSAPISQPRKPPAAVRALLLDLAARHRPTDPARVQAHLDQLALLETDMADAPVDRLKAAIDQWVRNSRWMPKASDLWDIIRRSTQPRQSASSDAYQAKLQARMEWGNNDLASKGRNDIRWVIRNGELKLDSVRNMERDAQRERQIEVEKAEGIWLGEQGHTSTYRMAQ